MKAKPGQPRSENRTPAAKPTIRRPIAVEPPKRRRWFLILSAAGVLLWTLFLAWMAWQD